MLLYLSSETVSSLRRQLEFGSERAFLHSENVYTFDSPPQNKATDSYTCVGWSIQIARIYLKSLLEFTFPGYSNNGVQSLSGGKTAGSTGVWRNITQGGIQDTALFPNRADGVILYVPGYSVDGILVSMAGGTNESFVSIYRALHF